jgi:Arc/MetJ-type ribon-helix-helix transcriptional regulator
MAAITVTLTNPETTAFVTKLVAEGKYASPSEAIDALVTEQRRRREERLAALLDEALEEPAIPATEEVWAGVRRRLEEKHPRVPSE